MVWSVFFRLWFLRPILDLNILNDRLDSVSSSALNFWSLLKKKATYCTPQHCCFRFQLSDAPKSWCLLCGAHWSALKTFLSFSRYQRNRVLVSKFHHLIGILTYVDYLLLVKNLVSHAAVEVKILKLNSFLNKGRYSSCVVQWCARVKILTWPGNRLIIMILVGSL